MNGTEACEAPSEPTVERAATIQRMRNPSLVALLALSACAGSTPPPAAPAAAKADRGTLTDYDTVKLAEGIFAFVSVDDESGIVNANTLLVIGDDGALVVDSGQFPTLTRRQVAEIRRLTSQPVRYVVTTHWHGDHHMGNVVYKEAFPGVELIAHSETIRLELKLWPKYLADARKEPLKNVPIVEERLKSGKRRDGRPLSADDRRHLETTIRDMKLYAEEVQLADFVPSTRAFEDRLVLRLGRREVQVLHLGRGNTAGDAVVYVPDAKVLAAGDLVVAPTPFAFGSYIREWPRTLDALARLDAKIIVPGHGPVMHDFSYVRHVRDALVQIDAQVQAAVAQGKTLEEAQAAVKVDAVVTGFAAPGPDDFRVRAFAQVFVAPAVERAYQEAQGKLEDEG
jgi:cyclase